MLVRAFILLNLTLFSLVSNAESCRDLFGTYDQNYVGETLADTLSGIALMHGSNHLIYDTVVIDSKTSSITAINRVTSPTNVAVDILIDTELASQRGDEKAKRHLEDVLTTLSQLEKHSSGLFFSWYSTETGGGIASKDVSSVDNMHLATALWTVKETFSGTDLGNLARELFSAMNFSMFYDVGTGLVGGNFSYVNGSWIRDAYNFANIGSEARTLYTLGWSLGVFKDISQSPDFVEKACEAIECELLQTNDEKLLRLWTGSAFQLFFPKIFAGEDVVSPTLKKMYEANGNYMIQEGLRRGISTPAAHSPGAISYSAQNLEVTYNPDAGNKGLVSTDNRDLQDPVAAAAWDAVFSPYALVMAATANPKLVSSLAKVQSEVPSMYVKGIGWVDAYHVSGANAGTVVPVQIAVNQGMIALSLLQIRSPDKMTASSRAIYKNKKIAARMRQAYSIVDRKLEATP